MHAVCLQLSKVCYMISYAIMAAAAHGCGCSLQVGELCNRCCMTYRQPSFWTYKQQQSHTYMLLLFNWCTTYIIYVVYHVYHICGIPRIYIMYIRGIPQQSTQCWQLQVASWCPNGASLAKSKQLMGRLQGI